MNEAVSVISHPIPDDKRFIDLTGKTYARLSVICYAGKRVECQSHMWWCECECGTIKKVYGTHLKYGNIKSCGCLNAEERRKTRFKIHGMTRTPEYEARREMISRCYRPTHISWPNYGGRGITVCDRWRFGEGEKSGFECFFEDMGLKPTRKHSLDRVENDGNYCKENCRWSTLMEQHNNTRANVRIEWEGQNLTIAEWARKIGLKYSTLKERIKRHPNDLERAFNPTPRKYVKNTKSPHDPSGEISIQAA